MKTENNSDLWGIIALLKRVILGCFLTITFIVGAFVAYLILGNTSTAVEATGVYNLVNSESGEIIATDLTKEDIQVIMECLNGEDKGN